MVGSNRNQLESSRCDDEAAQQEQQLSLFEDRPESSSKPNEIDVPGIVYREAFLRPDECDELVRKIDDQPWSNDLSRRVQHYGWRYDYTSKTVAEDTRLGPLPDWLLSIAERLHQEGFFEEIPDQVIINEYQPGQGIAPHMDRQTFGPTVATISLCECWPMEFTPIGRQAGRNGKRELFLGVGSLLVLKGDARDKWLHGIAKRKSDRPEPQKKERRPRQHRISVTFRTVIGSAHRRRSQHPLNRLGHPAAAFAAPLKRLPAQPALS